MASMRLDLPLPFGPMMDVNCLNGPMTWWPLYDLSLERRDGNLSQRKRKREKDRRGVLSRSRVRARAERRRSVRRDAGVHALEVLALDAGDHPFPDRHRALSGGRGDHPGFSRARRGCQQRDNGTGELGSPGRRSQTARAEGRRDDRWRAAPSSMSAAASRGGTWVPSLSRVARALVTRESCCAVGILARARINLDLSAATDRLIKSIKNTFCGCSTAVSLGA